MFDFLGTHGMQHARAPSPSPTPWGYTGMSIESVMPSNHLILCDAIQPFSPYPQSFPAPGWFQMSQLFILGGQNIGVSASTLVLPMNSQDWSPLGWTCWIHLHSKGLARVFSNTTVWKHQFFSTKLSYSLTLTSIADGCKKRYALLDRLFFGKVMFLLFNMLSSCIITCLPRSICLLISWLQSPYAVIL